MGLDIEGSFEEQWGMVKSSVRQHDAAINGNGQPGLLDFASGVKAQLRLLIALVSVGALILALLTFLELNRQMRTGMIRASDVLAPLNASAEIPPIDGRAAQ